MVRRMEIEEKRLKISQVYNGIAWKQRCLSMPAKQVCAVYEKFKQQGKFNTKKYKSDAKFHQISIGEYLEGRKNDVQT